MHVYLIVKWHFEAKSSIVFGKVLATLLQYL